MTTTIIGLHAVRFDVRTALGGCMLNLNGETYDVEVKKDSTYFTSPTYTIVNKADGKPLCYVRPHHIYTAMNTPFFQLKGVSASGGDGTLIVPLHGMLGDDEDLDDDDACVGYSPRDAFEH